MTVAFVLQPFSYKQFQITLQYQPQCVLCLEKIPLIIKALHKKQSQQLGHAKQKRQL